MQSGTSPNDRRKNRGFEANGDDVDLDQRDIARRGAHRLGLRLWTEGRHNGALDFHNCSNLAASGMFIENPDPYEMSAIVDIEFNLPGIPDPITVTGRVVSKLDADNAAENIMGNGFEFISIDEADQTLITAFVEANELAEG